MAKEAGEDGWASFCLRGGDGGVDTALWLDPPPEEGSKKAPKILPRPTTGPGGDLDPKLGKKMKMGFLNGVEGPVRIVIMCHVFGDRKSDHFQCSKKFSAPLALEFVLTYQWSCQLSPFPEPPVFGGSISPPPPPPPQK